MRTREELQAIYTDPECEWDKFNDIALEILLDIRELMLKLTTPAQAKSEAADEQ